MKVPIDSFVRPVLLLAAVLLGAMPVQFPAQTTADSPVTTELRRGEAALRDKDQAGAARFFENALKLDPQNAEAHANLGALAFSQGNCAVAEPHFKTALQQVAGLAKVRALLSICEHRRNDADALQDMRSAFDQLGESTLRLQLGMELANAFYQQGDLERTAFVLHSLLDQAPENVDVLFFAQRVYSELADNTLNKLAVLSPNSARMEQLIAERLINAGDLKDAIRHYRKALTLSPSLPGVHYELAEALLTSAPGDAAAQAEALRELQAALASDGETAKIEVQFGRISMARSEYPQAMEHFKRAAHLDPANVQAQTGLADLYRQEQKPEEAVACLRKAIDLDPLEPSSHYKLSQVDRQLNLEEDRKKELALFMKLRTAQGKVKLLYQEMVPQTANGAAEPVPQ